MKVLTWVLIFNTSLGACFPGFDTSHLVKIVDLMEHFELHQKEAESEGETLGLIEFLAMHYLEFDDHEHEGEEDHEKLPFQSLSTSIILYCHTMDWQEIHYNNISTSLAPSFYKDFLSNNFEKNIFRPPIFA